MKWIIRMFFRTLRRILGPVMLLIDKLTAPKGIQRAPAEQQKLDQATRDLALYQYRTCPFCMKVRHEIKRLSLNIELRDAQHNMQYREQLQTQGGELKVPCLRIVEQGGESWLYESDEVIKYLRQLAA